MVCITVFCMNVSMLFILDMQDFYHSNASLLIIDFAYVYHGVVLLSILIVGFAYTSCESLYYQAF